MPQLTPLKYLLTLSLAATAVVAFSLQGWWTFLPIAYAFGMVPLLEFLLPADRENLSQTEEALAKDNSFYDWMIYAIVGAQYILLGVFLWQVSQPGLEWYEYLGLIQTMGLLCGTYGINVGHELGHRRKKHERFLAKASLLTSLYMHFYIEHNRGHHKRVATEDDPASARYGEWVYTFWFRSIIEGYKSAWDLEKNRLENRGLAFWSWKNEMVRFTVIQGAFLLLIALVFSPLTVLYFVVAALMGALLLETVNYIEHYGLARNQLTSGGYERVQPHHSWNSNHVFGRLLLFELSRHSDHHYIAARPYQILRHHDDTPQMPTGYPGMMLLSLVPPLWFRIMHREIERLPVTA
ncbi:MAG: alkane 1-monooxygenase [Bacteroidota bacterium]